MVAYESVAYGSLLRIVAYEMFHVPGSEHNEKCKMKDEGSTLMCHVLCTVGHQIN